MKPLVSEPGESFVLLAEGLGSGLLDCRRLVQGSDEGPADTVVVIRLLGSSRASVLKSCQRSRWRCLL